MRIGLTYDLRSDYLAQGYTEDETAEFDRDDTIASIENALRRLGMRPSASATSAAWWSALPPAAGGILSSTSPRV